jgi:hypothetical protein
MIGRFDRPAERVSADTMKKRSRIGQAQGAVQQILGMNHAIAPGLVPTYNYENAKIRKQKMNQNECESPLTPRFVFAHFQTCEPFSLWFASLLVLAVLYYNCDPSIKERTAMRSPTLSVIIIAVTTPSSVTAFGFVPAYRARLTR